MSIFGLTISEWMIAGTAVLGATWSYFRLFAGYTSLEKEMMSIKNQANVRERWQDEAFTSLERKQKEGLELVKHEITARITSLELEMRRDSLSHASLVSTIVALKEAIQSNGHVIQRMNDRMDNIILTRKGHDEI